MFHFKKKKERIVVMDTVWLTEQAKWMGCMEAAKKNKDTVFAVWFDESFRKIEKFFSDNNMPTDHIFITRELGHNYIQKPPLIFVEHYPLFYKEEELYQKLALSPVTVYSSLDEPLFIQFGGGKICELMKKMGMKEDEPIGNELISSSIKNAQEKLKNKITLEQYATSQAEWFFKNF